MSTAAGPPDALTRRIEQLAAASGSEASEAESAVVAVVEALQAEMGALRSETAAVRSRLDGLGGLAERVEALARDGASTTTSLLHGLGTSVRALGERTVALEQALGPQLVASLAEREDALRAELLSALRAGREQAARDRDATQELAVTVRTALDGLSTALAPEEGRAARLLATVESGLDHVRAQVTTELTAARRELASAVATQVAAAVHAQTAALGPRVDALAAAAGATDASLQELRTELLTTVADLRDRVLTTTVDATETLREQVLERLGAVVTGLARADQASATAGERLAALTTASEDVRRTVAGLSDEAASRLAEIDAQVGQQLEAVRAQFETRADELAGTLARGLLDIAEEVDVAATTTRDASSRVTVLTEVSEAQRAEVERLLRDVHADVVDAGRGLREDLLARTGELVAGLGARVDDLGAGLGGVDATLADSAAAAERVAAALERLTASTGRLDEAVAGFRTEWPTRTYEVVQGARAVAEGVVRDVRLEVSANLDQVRAVLEQVVGQVDGARGDLDEGTDRLARAGSVLVAYLEQRDRLLEAERDRVLHDVLDAFAAGLSARERSALAGRVTDVVARRRDARDAERYRAAVGRPVSPTVGLPEHVSTLAPRPALERVSGEGRSGGGAAEQGVAGQGQAGQGVAGQGEAGQGVAGQGVAGQGVARPGDAGPASPDDGLGPGAAGAGRGAAVDPAAPADMPSAADRAAAQDRDLPTAPPTASPTRPVVAPARSAAAAGRPAGLRRGPGSAQVVPGPGRQGSGTGVPQPGSAVPRTGTAVRRPARTVAAPARGRLGAMPRAPRVDVALDAASSPPPSRSAQEDLPTGPPRDADTSQD